VNFKLFDKEKIVKVTVYTKNKVSFKEIIQEFRKKHKIYSKRRIVDIRQELFNSKYGKCYSTQFDVLMTDYENIN